MKKTKINKKGNNSVKVILLSAVLVGLFQVIYNIIVTLISKNDLIISQLIPSFFEGAGFFVIVALLFTFSKVDFKKLGVIVFFSFFLAILQSGLQLVLHAGAGYSVYILSYVSLVLIKAFSTFIALEISNVVTK
jgi:hypothetical protein